MRTPLPVGTHLTLSAIGTQHQITVQIQELIGTGASCLVYTAVCRDGEQNEFYLRLKEFCPENLHLHFPAGYCNDSRVLTNSDSVLCGKRKCKYVGTLYERNLASCTAASCICRYRT